LKQTANTVTVSRRFSVNFDVYALLVHPVDDATTSMSMSCSVSQIFILYDDGVSDYRRISRREKVRFKTGFKINGRTFSLFQMSGYAEGENSNSSENRPTQKAREAKDDLTQGGTASR